MPTRSAKITQADFDALAALANAKLLPLVNAAIAAGKWPYFDTDFFFGVPHSGNFYDIYTTSNFTNLANPQPPYSFANVGEGENIIPSDAVYDADGNYFINIDNDSYYIFEVPDGNAEIISFGADDFFYSGYFISGMVFKTAASFVGLANYSGSAGPVMATLRKTSKSWVQELNRIRGDWWCLIFNKGLGADALYQSKDAIISGPWCVGVNDPETFPISRLGILRGSDGNNLFCYFKNPSFCYALNDALDGLTIDGTMKSPVPYDSHDFSGTRTLSSKISSSVNGMMNLNPFQISISGSGAAPSADSLDFATNFGSATVVLVSNTGGIATYNVTVNDIPISAEIELDLTISWSAPSGWGLSGNSSVSGVMTFGTSSAPSSVSGIHPQSDCMIVNFLTDPPDAVARLEIIANSSSFSGITTGLVEWTLSNVNVKGCWISKTLPTPAVNTFIAQDIAPYIGAIGQNFPAGELIGISGTLPYYAFGGVTLTGPWGSRDFEWLDNPPTTQFDNSQPSFLDSQRQSAAIYRGEQYLKFTFEGVPFSIDAGPEYNYVKQSVQCQPAQWPVTRDTDVVPLKYGDSFDLGQHFTSINNTLTGKQRIDPPLDFFVFTNAVSLKIRVCKPGTDVTWNYQYTPPDSPLTIKVWNGTDPRTTPPHLTGINELTIRSSGLLKPKNSIWNVTVENPNAADDEDTNYVLFVDVDTGEKNYPVMIPAFKECFGHSVDGTPWGMDYPRYIDYFDIFNPRPIPQNGYCIFKVRATRRPVANNAGILVTPESGDELTITIGQNRFQPDGTYSFAPFLTDQMQGGAGSTTSGAGGSGGAGGSATPFTIKIPADARDSGDVEVFIPVLLGNVLVYQCGDQIILEAWANWQPMFHSDYLGRFPVGGYPITPPNPTSFKNCLSFANWFDGFHANMPGYQQQFLSHTQFSLSVEIYNDLMAVLGLID